MKVFAKFKLKSLAWLILIFACVCFAFSYLVIKDFSNPLSGRYGNGSDLMVDKDFVDTFEYPGFYFLQNIQLLPFPHLDLVNNQSFYPYPTNQVFQMWGFERDSFYAIASAIFGRGPWLQIYYLSTVLVTAIGTFALLVKDWGKVRASGAGFIVSFCNFYAINKYPHHFNISVVHWTTLNLVADFLLVKRIVCRQSISLRLLLVRTCLLILALSQDLGYIAGFALMSFTLSVIFIAALLGYRYFKKQISATKTLTNLIENYKIEFNRHAFTCSILIAVNAIAAYFYLPLVIQIARAAKSFDMSEIPGLTYWVNPLRLSIPYLPNFNPSLPLKKLFFDSPEGLGAGSPGWFLLFLGTLGLWQAFTDWSRQSKQSQPPNHPLKIIIFIPLIVTFVLCLFYHPKYLPTLKIFPWFAFNRVGGRSTVIYPVILCLFALEINWDRLRLSRKKWLAALLVCLACTELYTAYSFKQNYQPHSFDKNFFTYMNYVKKQPGEAVLDWPFCFTGSNGIGSCPYYLYNSGIYALRRFHHKKVVGQNFGRLHPSQAEPYFLAGWDKLLVRQYENFQQQKGCFNSLEWSLFSDFYKLNDFAGINLYIDLLPKDCAKEFYARFGNSVLSTEVSEAGRVEFIPKLPELRAMDN